VSFSGIACGNVFCRTSRCQRDRSGEWITKMLLNIYVPTTLKRKMTLSMNLEMYVQLWTLDQVKMSVSTLIKLSDIMGSVVALVLCQQRLGFSLRKDKFWPPTESTPLTDCQNFVTGNYSNPYIFHKFNVNLFTGMCKMCTAHTPVFKLLRTLRMSRYEYYRSGCDNRFLFKNEYILYLQNIKQNLSYKN